MKKHTLKTINSAIWNLTENGTLGRASAEATYELHQETEADEFVNEKRARALAIKHLGVERLLKMTEHLVDQLNEEAETSTDAVLSSILEEEDNTHQEQLQKAREVKKRLERVINRVEGQILETLHLDYTEDPQPVDGLHEERAF